MIDKPSSLLQVVEKVLGFNRQARGPTEPRGVVAAACNFFATGTSLRMGRTWNLV